MTSPRKIVLAVGGGIAAYKAALLARECLRRGVEVRVAMTPASTRFVGPVTFTGLTGRPPVVDLWDPGHGGEVHVELADWADAIVVAPATASLLAKMVAGLADDPVTATLLCFGGPRLVAPAMHHRMWANDATQRNVEQLRRDGVRFVGPTDGPLASGASGLGRMAEPDVIADALERMLDELDGGADDAADLRGRTLVVTAGPTHEPLDPVRFLGNRSSGKMGYALAERAQRRGARVVLVSGPVALPAPAGVTVHGVTTALEMEAAVAPHLATADAIIMAAAVADFRPAEVSSSKLKKQAGVDVTTVALVRNPDILGGLGQARAASGTRRPMLVGFAVETEDVVGEARRKRISKQVDLVVGNHAGVAFEGDENEAVLVSATREDATGRLSKHALADRILDAVRAQLEG